MAEATPNPDHQADWITIRWPNGAITRARPGSDWLEAARQADLSIPTGCLGGSCGACELTVNGQTLRACLAVVSSTGTTLTVEPWDDPSW